MFCFAFKPPKSVASVSALVKALALVLVALAAALAPALPRSPKLTLRPLEKGEKTANAWASELREAAFAQQASVAFGCRAS
jgi:hypothetical protein